MSAFHTILVEFDGDQPGYFKGMKVLGGEIAAVAFTDALAELERVTGQRDELLEALHIIAAYPVQEFALEDKPERKLFGANDWELHVKDVLAARAAIAKATGEQA